MPTTQSPEQRGLQDAMVRGAGKAMRIEAMTGELLEELRSASLDEASRARVAAIHDRTVRELADTLPDGMREEFGRLVTEFGSAPAPSDGELRVAEAQLLGWVGGVVASAEAMRTLRALNAEMASAEWGSPDAPVATAAAATSGTARSGAGGEAASAAARLDRGAGGEVQRAVSGYL